MSGDETPKPKFARRKLALGGISIMLAIAASIGITRSCRPEQVSNTFCGHMESMMGDVAGAQFAGLREGTFSNLILHLSPHISDTLQLLIDDAPAETSPLFEILQANFDLGELLLKRTMGYSDVEIEAVKQIEFNENTRLADVLVPETSPDSLESASANLEDLLGGTYFARKAGETPRFRADGVRCGVFPEPDDDECPDVLSAETVATAFKIDVEEFTNRVTTTWDDGNCLWIITFPPTPSNPNPTDAYLWVDVFSNDVANRVLTARLADPGDVEEQPVIVDGARTSVGVFPCGRTAYVDMDDRSAVIAACGPKDLSEMTLTNTAIEAIESR
jgi:hypothetical protein